MYTNMAGNGLTSKISDQTKTMFKGFFSDCSSSSNS